MKQIKNCFILTPLLYLQLDVHCKQYFRNGTYRIRNQESEYFKQWNKWFEMCKTNNAKVKLLKKLRVLF